MSAQIYSKDEFFKIWGGEKLNLDLVSQDTYNESEIEKSIREIGLGICGAIAIQLSIVGFGNKSYGFVIFNKEKIEIIKFFEDHKIIWNSRLSDKLDPKTLTPRRLIRFYRYLTQKYLIENEKYGSYLYRKYCPIKSEKLRTWIYPGVEHVLKPEMENIEEILIPFIQSYIILDERLGIKISDRIKRVLYARGFTPIYIETLINNLTIKQIETK